MHLTILPLSPRWKSHILSQSPNSHCNLDPIPTIVLKKITNEIAPTILYTVTSPFLLVLPLLKIISNHSVTNNLLLKCLAFAFSISVPFSQPWPLRLTPSSFYLNRHFRTTPIISHISCFHSASSLILNLSLAKCHKAPLWDLSFLIFTSPFLVFSLVSLPSHTSFMPTMLNFSALSFPLTILLLPST